MNPRAGAPLLLAAATACGAPQLAWYGHTPDRMRIVEVRQQAKAQWLVVGGRASRRYRAIAADHLVFDPAGHRLAFAAEVAERPERWSVVADFVEGSAWDGVAGLRFGPSGRRFVYAALQDAHWRVVVDGVPQRPFDEVDIGSLAFSPDGERVAYVAKDGACVRAVVEAVPGDCATRVVALSPGNAARDDLTVIADAADGSAAHIFVGARRVLDLPQVRAVAVDPTVRHWAAVARSSDGWRLVVDEHEEESFDEIDHVVWASDGGAVAYTARRDGGWRVVKGGRVSEPYKEVEDPVFAANGSRMGYVARDAGRSVVAVDDRVLWESSAPATALALSDDGSRVGWFYRDAGATVIAVDGERYPFDVAIERTLRFSHDGRHWAALAGSLADRRLFVVVDGMTRIPFDAQEFFGDSGGDPVARLASWVSAELDLYLSRHEPRGS